jgi:hypothetical protein
MSSSGNATGITTAYIRDAQDVTAQRKRQLAYLDFTRGVPINHTPNGNESYLTFLFGKKECVAGCVGLPFQLRDVRLFR